MPLCLNFHEFYLPFQYIIIKVLPQIVEFSRAEKIDYDDESLFINSYDRIFPDKSVYFAVIS